jgi:dihydroflavonol-4-reductase
MIPEETKIAITGSTGHLATAVIPLLISKGYRIKALVFKQSATFDSIAVKTVHGSLSNISSLNQLVKGCQVVIHCAARISLNSNRDPSVYETNVTGTVNVFNASKRAGVKRFIHISSIHAYDQLPADELLNEESSYSSKKAPRYDQSKRDAQQFVLQNSSGPMEVVVLNPTAVIGPFDSKPSLLGKAILDIYNRRVPMLISGGFDFCDVRDVALSVASALDKGRNGQAYLLAGKWHNLKDLQKIILNIKGDARGLPVLPAWTAYLGLPFIQLWSEVKRREPLYTKESVAALTQGNRNISSQKAAAELGYNCRPLKDTIADSINWFKEAGYLNKT